MAQRGPDPILTYRFVLELGFLEVAGFSECTGLSQETKLMEYREGGRNWGPLKLPDVGAVGNIVLKRGIVPGGQADALFAWQSKVMHGEKKANNPNGRLSPDVDLDKRCAIVLKDDAGQEVMRWTLVRALPVKWSGPELKAASSDVAVETLELACEGLELSKGR